MALPPSGPSLPAPASGAANPLAAILGGGMPGAMTAPPVPNAAAPAPSAPTPPPAVDVEERIEWEDLDRDLSLDLSPDDETALVTDVLAAIRAAMDGRKGVLETVRKVRERFYLVPPTDRGELEPWQANWHVPFTRWVMDGINSRLWGTAFGQGKENMVLVTGVRGRTDVDRASRAEPFLQYVNERELHFAQLYDEVIERVGTDGHVMLKVPWRRIIRKMRRRRRVETSEQTTDEATGLPVLNELNQPKITRILRYVAELEDEELYHGPRAELVTIDNFIVPNPNESDVNKQPWTAQQFWLTRNEIWQDRRREVTLDGQTTTVGAYRNVSTLLHPQRREDTSEHQLEATAGQQEGVSPQVTTPDLVGQVQCFEVIWPYRAWRQAKDPALSDAEAEKLAPRALLTITGQERVLLQATEYPYWDPEPETLWVKVATIGKEGRWYNQAPGELLMSVQDELDTIHWQRSDATTVMILAFNTLIAEEGAADDLKKLALGAKNIVTSLDGIKLLADVVKIAIQVPGMDVESLLMRMGELLSGIGDPQLGQIGRSGTTAYEVGAVLREGNLKFAKMIARLGDAAVAVDQIALRRYAQYYPLVAPKLFRIKGGERDVIEELALEDLQFGYDLELRGASITVNKELAAAKALRVLQLSDQNLFFNALLLGNPAGVYELVSTVLAQIEWPGGAEVLIGTRDQALQHLGPILVALAAMRGVPGPGGGGNGGGPTTTQNSPIAELLNAAGLTPELAALGGKRTLASALETHPGGEIPPATQ